MEAKYEKLFEQFIFTPGACPNFKAISIVIVIISKTGLN